MHLTKSGNLLTGSRTVLGRVFAKVGVAPKYLITDKGKQFWKCAAYTAWCRRHSITPRFGAVGQPSSVAVVERAIKTLKSEGTSRMAVALKHNAFQNEFFLLAAWYNLHRPHATLDGRTPDDTLAPSRTRQVR